MLGDDFLLNNYCDNKLIIDIKFLFCVWGLDRLG